ncbi:MAG: hypothetical protein KDE51_18910, partial [Anaerolineales bacterium]|nr:hypothetical protein [Anaerolineales bacterium]
MLSVQRKPLLLLGLIIVWVMVVIQGSVARGAANQQDITVNYDIYEQDVVLIEFADSEMVRLRDGRPQNLNQSRAALGTDELEQLAAGGEWQRPYTLSEAKLEAMRINGEARTGRQLPRLNNRLRLQLPAGMDAQEAVVLLGSLPIVQKVHLIPKPVATPLTLDYSVAGNDTGNPVVDPYQGYLDAAPKGLDARYAWQIPGGDGFGVSVCDVEYDYNADHADINNVTFVGDPKDPPFDDNHGTAVLGMIGGADNGYGVRGIAYGA